PLLRPPVYNIDYQEREYVVKQAKNVETLGHSVTTGLRPAGTLGPIVNGALYRPDEPIVDTERLAVITIENNFATLGEIMNLNINYQRTTNSDAITLAGNTIG